MKTTKIFTAVALLMIMFNLVACGHVNLHGNKDKNTNEEQKITYVYSPEKCLHLPTCSAVNKMDKEFIKEYSGDLSVMQAKGYTLCKICIAKDDKNDKEEKVPVIDEDEVPANEATFVVNRSNLKIHETNCTTIAKMSESNIKYTCLTYEELLEKDHMPCGTCMHDQYEAYKKAHPEKFPTDDE